MRTIIIPFLALLLLLGASCTSSEIGNSKDVNPDAVFFDYKIWSEEGKEDAVVKLQYRMGGPDGTTLVLNEPSKVFLDGKELPVDSTKFEGAYYEFVQPLAQFAGKHTIRFIDLNGKKFEEEFEFRPFSLDPDIADTITRSDLVFSFKGLEDGQPVQVWMSDTLYSSDDINELDTVRQGKIAVSSAQLSKLANGPVNLLFTWESEKVLNETAREGGLLRKTYSLRREIELKD